MKTLIEFLLAEAKSGEENTEVASINQEDWRLCKIDEFNFNFCKRF